MTLQNQCQNIIESHLFMTVQVLRNHGRTVIHNTFFGEFNATEHLSVLRLRICCSIGRQKIINDKDSQVMFMNCFEFTSYMNIDMYMAHKFLFYVLFSTIQFYVNLHLEFFRETSKNSTKNLIIQNIITETLQSIFRRSFRMLQFKMRWYEQSTLQLIKMKILESIKICF